MISEEIIQQSEARLDFNPEQRSEELKGKNPLIATTPAEEVRANLRLAHVMNEAGEAARIEFERIINNSDLMNINYLEKGMMAANAIARISVRGSSGELLGYGTGFMVSENLIMTNNHVLTNKEAARNSQAEFNYQFDKSGRPLASHLFGLRPNDFFYTNVDLDFTLVAVEKKSQSGQVSLSRFGFLKLNPTIGKVSEGEYLTIIQHPSGQVKQIAIRENQLLKIAENHLWYKTDTAPGSSGSPVFNDLWQMVALHHSGVPEKNAQGQILAINGQVWMAAMGEDKIKWIANEGVRVSRILDNVTRNSGNSPFIKSMLAESALPSNDTSGGDMNEAPDLTGNASPSVANPPIQVGSTGTGAISITLPLTITVGLGVPGAAQSAAGGGGVIAPAPPPVEPPDIEAVSIDPDYSNRQGYNANFLGTGTKRVTLPQLSAAMKAKAAENSEATGADKTLIPYHHFTIVMNKERKLAFYTAVNIDGKKHFSIKRETDRWIMDPRLDDGFQAGEAIYKNNPLDRGHLVRRLDPAWGSSQTLAKFANDDTFHFTNCSPQHQDFNQGQTLWAGLEDYILNNAKAEDLKVTVFTGPVFANNDRQYRGIKLPKQFWKVVTMVKKDTGKLSATAYLLSQASLISNLEAEVFSYGAYRTFQVRVKKIEDLSGLKFGNLATSDPLNLHEAEVTREVNSFEDIAF